MMTDIRAPCRGKLAQDPMSTGLAAVGSNISPFLAVVPVASVAYSVNETFSTAVCHRDMVGDSAARLDVGVGKKVPGIRPGGAGRGHRPADLPGGRRRR